MGSTFGRRAFLKQGLATAAVLSGFRLQAASTPLGSLERTDTPKRVIIIGAGLAGLSAAFELDLAGHHVTILEAQARAGGRVFTLREPFAGGMHADAGAARIHANHRWTLGYIARFGLELVPFYASRHDFIYFDGRTRVRVDWSQFAQQLDRWLWMRVGKGKHWFKIKGGNDLLPRAFADRLGDKIIYQAPVAKIKQDTAKVHVSFSEKGVLQTRSADYLICTIPFTVLKNVEVVPAFSAEKQSAIKRLKYDSASRVFLQFHNRFWLSKQTNGFAITDVPAEIWPSTFKQPGNQGILQSYTRQTMSRHITGLPEDERIETTIKQIERVFPSTRNNFLQGASKCWSEDPWVRAAWAHPAWDDLPTLRHPEGRVYLAGEHTSAWPSWMQGALEAGNWAATKVHRASV